MALNHREKEVRYLNILGTESVVTKLYFYRKRVLLMIHLRNGGIIFKDKYFFSWN